jgi:glycosyltransferase involved in cell wall biosynthesis
MTYKQSLIKQKIEYILLYPIVFIGKICSKFFKPSKQYTHFFFFPHAGSGGSITVNADIVKLLKDKSILIIFSKKIAQNNFLHLFKHSHVDILDLSKLIDNKYFHFVNVFYRGVIATWINNTHNPIIFGGDALYLYKVIPHLKNEVKIVELSHLNVWYNYTQAFLKKIDVRVFSTNIIKKEAEELYKRNNLPEEWYQKMYFIDNKIEIPVIEYTQNKQLKILFVGRAVPQKRIHLLVEIARIAHQEKLKADFIFVGNVHKYFNDNIPENCRIHGEVNDRKKLENIYNESDALLLTSAFEGLPMVVMDMMVRGKIIISTNVGAIPDYITDKETGLLIQNINEQSVVKQGVEIIKKLIANSELQQKIKIQTYEYAKDKFGAEHFDNFYKVHLS